MADSELILLQEPRMPFEAQTDTIDTVRKENARLRAILITLSAIIAKNVVAANN